jgi:hypothetical protein
LIFIKIFLLTIKNIMSFMRVSRRLRIYWVKKWMTSATTPTFSSLNSFDTFICYKNPGRQTQKL